jgi:DNA gyrase/topoisomerase IV subunit A
MLITNKGQMVRTRVKEIRETGRNTIDVKLMDLRNSEKPFLFPMALQLPNEGG